MVGHCSPLIPFETDFYICKRDGDGPLGYAPLFSYAAQLGEQFMSEVDRSKPSVRPPNPTTRLIRANSELIRCSGTRLSWRPPFIARADSR
jgi:hypothetical protein